MAGRGKDQLVQVEIYGQRYTLKATKDPSWVESVAAHVDRKMREISASTPTVDSLKVAILAAVNIADEYFQLKVEGEAIEDRIAEKADQLSDLLEASLRERAAR